MSYIDPDDDPALHRLEGSEVNQKGGLILMKKKTDEQHTFKKPALPMKSLLGLDRLAQAKRKAGEEDAEVKRSKVTSFKDGGSDEELDYDDDDDDSSSKSKKERKDRFDMILHVGTWA